MQFWCLCIWCKLWRVHVDHGDLDRSTCWLYLLPAVVDCDYLSAYTDVHANLWDGGRQMVNNLGAHIVRQWGLLLRFVTQNVSQRAGKSIATQVGKICHKMNWVGVQLRDTVCLACVRLWVQVSVPGWGGERSKMFDPPWPWKSFLYITSSSSEEWALTYLNHKHVS